jgi:hypothetical protein
VGVGLDQAGQDRRVTMVDEWPIRGHLVRRGLDAHDAPTTDQNCRTLIAEAFTVEGVQGADREHLRPALSR